MNRYFKFLFTVVFCLMASGIYAKTTLPIVEILGEKYYVYESHKGDSLFGICREFGWDLDVLQKLNPNIVSPLPKGVNLYYPASDINDSTVKHVDPATIAKDVELPANPKFYTIKRGDTLYSVAKAHNTTVAEILKLNPGVSETNFKADSSIKLPVAGAGRSIETVTVTEQKLESLTSYEVQKGETWYGIAQKFGVSVESLQNANPGVRTLQKKQIIMIPKITNVNVEQQQYAEDPREQSREGVQYIYDEVHGIADADVQYRVRAAVILSEPNTKKDAEFSRGFLTALDQHKHDGKGYDIKFIDGTKNSVEVITELDDFKPVIVFITAEKNIPAYVSEYAQASRTPVVNVFDVKSETYQENPYFIQMLTPSADFNNEIVDYIADRYQGYELVFIGNEDVDDQMAIALKDVWSKSALSAVSAEYLPEYNVSDDSRILFYGTPTKKNDVSDILRKVTKLKEQYPFANIELMGRPNWIVLDDVLADVMHSASTMIPSRFYYDADDTRSKIFEMNYKKNFEQSPTKSFPMYAPLGYDVAEFFLNGLLDSRGDINILRPYRGLQSDYSLTRTNNWGGLYSPVVYLVRFTDYGTIDRVVVGN